MTNVLDSRSLRSALWLSVFVTAFNVMVLVTLTRTIVRDLGTTIGTGQTALVLLAVVTALASPGAENLSQLYGRKRVFRTGLVLFAAGLLVAVTGKTSFALLFGICILGGLGAAALVTTPFAAVAGSSLPKPDRRRLTGYLMLALTVGALLGPVSAGLITLVADWGWAFAPQLVLVVVITWLTSDLPPSPERTDEHVDWIGTALSLTALGCTVVGIGLGGEYGWWAPRKPFLVAGITIPPFELSIAPTLIIVGLIAGLGALIWARAGPRRQAASAWRLQPLRDTQFLLFAFLVLLLAAIDTGVSYALYTYLPIAAEITTIQIVLLMLPKTGVTLLVAIGLVYRGVAVGEQVRLVQAGFAFFLAGALLLAALAGDRWLLAVVVIGVAILGAGMGLASRGLFDLSTTWVRRDRPASALFVSSTDLGAAIGVAVIGSILIAVAALQITATIGGVDLQGDTPLTLIDAADQFEDALQHLTTDEEFELGAAIESIDPLESVVRDSIGRALRSGLFAIATAALVGVFASFFLMRRETPAESSPPT